MKSSADDDVSTKTRRRAKPTDALRELAGRVAAVLALQPTTVDRDALRVLLRPPRLLRTLSEVALVFGRSANTVGRSWRDTGMPGRPGAFDVVDIAAWLLEREIKNRQRTAPSARSQAILDELAAIEVEMARTNLEIRRARAASTSNQYVRFEYVRMFFQIVAGRAREHIMELPDRCLPFLPGDNRHELAQEIERECRSVLHGLADDLEQRFVDGTDFSEQMEQMGVVGAKNEDD